MKFQTSDSVVIDVDDSIVKYFKTITRMLDLLKKSDDVIPVLRVSSRALQAIEEWIILFEKKGGITDDIHTNVCDWALRFLKDDVKFFDEILAAANYLEIPALIRTCKRSRISKSVEHIPESVILKRRKVNEDFIRNIKIKIDCQGHYVKVKK